MSVEAPLYFCGLASAFTNKSTVPWFMCVLFWAVIYCTSRALGLSAILLADGGILGCSASTMRIPPQDHGDRLATAQKHVVEDNRPVFIVAQAVIHQSVFYEGKLLDSPEAGESSLD